MQEEFIAEAGRWLLGNYRRLPLALVRGEGPWVWDRSGRRYLDLIGGIAVCALGHCHPEVVGAVRDQAMRLLHASNLFWLEPQVELARALVERAFPGRVFFCNSGAEAVEAALKLARRWGNARGRVELVAALGSFHGRTLGALSVTGQERLREGFGPLLPGVRFVPFGDEAALEEAISERTCALILEPVQGEAGVRVPPAGYLRAARRLCDRWGALLILDEVQTGMGRSGAWFCHQRFGVRPDLMCLAKALGGGLPLGALLVREELAEWLPPGSHASTFGGNPVSCAAGLATLRVIEREGLLARCRELGDWLREELSGLPGPVREARGMGLLLGLELERGAERVVDACRERGLLLNLTAGSVIRLAPPLNVRREELSWALEVLEEELSAL